MKVLVIQLGDAADVLLTTPLLRCIKQQLNEVKLHVLVQSNAAEILAPNSYINHLHQLHFNWKTTAEALKPENFDHVINLHSSKEAEAIEEALHVIQPPQKQKGFKTFFQHLFHRNSTAHTAIQYIQKAKALGVTNDGEGLHLTIPRTAQISYSDIPAAHQAGYLVIALPLLNDDATTQGILQPLVATIQHPIILIGTNAERGLGEKIKSVDDIKIYNACGKFSTAENGDLIRKSKLVVASKPFYVQTAAAFQKELVWLKLGNNTPPYYGANYLKKQSAAPYDVIQLPQAILKQSNQTELQKEKERLVTQLAAAINKRLRPKAKTQTQ